MCAEKDPIFLYVTSYSHICTKCNIFLMYIILLSQKTRGEKKKSRQSASRVIYITRESILLLSPQKRTSTHEKRIYVFFVVLVFFPSYYFSAFLHNRLFLLSRQKLFHVERPNRSLNRISFDLKTFRLL